MQPMNPQPPGPPQGYPAQYGSPPQGGQQIPEGQYMHAGMSPYPPPPFPPQKSGMPTWGWVLIGCGGLFAVFLIVGILALAAIPLITTNTREARQAEGEQLLTSMRNRARVAYSRTSRPPVTLTGDASVGGAGMDYHELQGVYYTARDTIGAPSSSEGELYCDPIHSGDGSGTMRFSWLDSRYMITWQ
jgi:hypothetical protein